MTVPDSSVGVERALGAVAEVHAELHELELALADRTRELGEQLLVLGADLREAGLPADRDLVRRLYWVASKLPTQAIYEALGLRSPNDVSIIAGPGEFHLPCKDCRTTVTCQAANRTQLLKLRGSIRCEACTNIAAERDRQHLAERDAQIRRHKRETDAAVRRAMEAYVLDHPDLPEEPVGTEMLVEIPVPEWGGSTVSLRDLLMVRAELRDRLRPRAGK